MHASHVGQFLSMTLEGIDKNWERKVCVWDSRQNKDWDVETWRWDWVINIEHVMIRCKESTIIRLRIATPKGLLDALRPFRQSKQVAAGNKDMTCTFFLQLINAETMEVLPCCTKSIPRFGISLYRLCTCTYHAATTSDVQIITEPYGSRPSLLDVLHPSGGSSPSMDIGAISPCSIDDHLVRRIPPTDRIY